MDFDSIITFILIVLFFVFPSILKQLSRKKKTSAAPNKANKAKKPSLFGKLGDKIRKFAEEIEKQAKEKKQGQGWEEIIDDQEMVKTYEDPFDPDAYEDDGYHEALEPMQEPSISVAVSEEPGKPVLKSGKPSSGRENCFGNAYGKTRLSSSRLQQAIIWSEILSKPVALREE
ncbi:MAG: hypothetical protein B6230_04160 [Desulfobacteraceae bacterium 4572_89]|nr:MAG: hypothetical protein B6230_04160 [Desulfobacteraceae bacterium 4572_89]